jgi:hypothetical protein
VQLSPEHEVSSDCVVTVLWHLKGSGYSTYPMSLSRLESADKRSTFMLISLNLLSSEVSVVSFRSIAFHKRFQTRCKVNWKYSEQSDDK